MFPCTVFIFGNVSLHHFHLAQYFFALLSWIMVLFTAFYLGCFLALLLSAIIIIIALFVVILKLQVQYVFVNNLCTNLKDV